jgi:LysM repeat protein
MHDHRRTRFFARLLAPLALIAFAVLVAAIVLGSGVVGGDDDGGSSSSTSDLPAATDSTTTTTGSQKKPRKTYTIKANDTLSGIAAATGTTVDRLQELNPELDPQGLVAGQKIKLRE